jgi:hypothetical protein
LLPYYNNHLPSPPPSYHSLQVSRAHPYIGKERMVGGGGTAPIALVILCGVSSSVIEIIYIWDSVFYFILLNTATSYRSLSPPATVWSQLYEQYPPARRLYRGRRPPSRCHRQLPRASAAFRQPRSQDLVGFPLPCPAVPLTGSRVLPTL